MKQNMIEMEQDLQKTLIEDDIDEKGGDKNDNYENQKENAVMAMKIEITIYDINGKLHCVFAKKNNESNENNKSNASNNSNNANNLKFRYEVYDKMSQEKDFQQEYFFYVQLYDHS